MSRKPIYKRLDIASAFSKLSRNDQLYLHHLNRAAWLGTRIILQQVSPEANDIFDLIVELHRLCKGDWTFFISNKFDEVDKAEHELEEFLTYAAQFLSNVGNYYGKGDKKFIPKVSSHFIFQLASHSDRARDLASRCSDAMLDPQPESLGYSGKTAQSRYYLSPMSAEEVDSVSKVVLSNDLALENTRLSKVQVNGTSEYHVLQASVEGDNEPCNLGTLNTSPHSHVKLVRGDHASILKRIAGAVSQAAEYCENDRRRKMLVALEKSFYTGDNNHNKDALKLWVQDTDPQVDLVLGFVEQYRDPHGTRAEFLGITTIQDPDESAVLKILVDSSQKFISTLPWIPDNHDKDNGPFETQRFESPSFTSVQAFTYASSYIFLGINLPNYEDIKETLGFKNFLIANREKQMLPEELKNPENAPFVAEDERVQFLTLRNASVRQKVVIHELFGHGTGRLLTAENIDTNNPPINPLTGEPITSWYQKGERYRDVFGDLAAPMEECRADCVGLDLMCDKRLVALFGYDETSSITADDLVYNAYLLIGVLGIEALQSYSPETKTWGQAHGQGRFVMMRALLDLNGFMKIRVDAEENRVTVSIDRKQLYSDGRKAIRDLLLKIHIHKCTADVSAARAFFGRQSQVDDYWLSIRDLVQLHEPRQEVFVQANTFLEGDGVRLKEYDLTAQGCIRSWIERCDLFDL